jgi:hypothetical protein
MLELFEFDGRPFLLACNERSTLKLIIDDESSRDKRPKFAGRIFMNTRVMLVEDWAFSCSSGSYGHFIEERLVSFSDFSPLAL